VGVDRIVEEGIWGIEEEVYKRTSVASARLRKKNEDESRYIRLCNKKSTINGV